MKYDLLTILGPTASGKTKIATQLANSINGEIISADSRQVYKKMNIGTGKDYEEYIVKGKKIPYHLIDIREAGTQYNLFDFQQDFLSAYKNIKDRNKQPILCGGTGLYISAVTKPYYLTSSGINSSLRNELNQKDLSDIQVLALKNNIQVPKSDFENKVRLIRYLEIAFDKTKIKFTFPSLKTLFIGIDIDRETLRNSINKRLEERLKNGLIDEVKHLLNTIPAETLIKYGLEYKYLTLFLLGKIRHDEMQTKLATAIYQFSRRQRSWFRRMERQGTVILWLNYSLPNQKKITKIMELISQ